MLKRTMPFDYNSHEIKSGIEVPRNGVNLAHHYAQPLIPNENIVISDNSSFIKMNTSSQEEIMYSGEDYILRNKISDASILNGELVEITDKFFGDIPLYYCHKLKNLFYGETSLLSGPYFGSSIKLQDFYGNDIPNSFKYIVYLKKANVRELQIDASKYILSQIYEVYIYTSFQIENNYRVRCHYNAMIKGEDGYTVVANTAESINPQPFFKKSSNVLDTIERDNLYHLQKSYKEIRSSMLYIGSVMKDDRKPQMMRVRVDVTFSDGAMQTIYFPQDENERIELYNIKSAIDSEMINFEDDRQVISQFNINSYLDRDDIVGVVPVVSSIDRGQPNIEFYVRPDGKGKLYASTTLEQPSIDGSLIKKLIKHGDNIFTCYSVLMKDKRPIKLLKPREISANSAWYLRVQNGKFSVLDGTAIYHYFLPEYYNQVFSSKYGYPYKNVTKEVPILMSNNSIRVKCSPIFAGSIDDIYVRKVYDDGTVIDLGVDSWNTNDGVINLTEFINENDNIYVDYVYEEDSYIYTGYNEVGTGTNIYLDCNPNKHHFCSSSINGQMVDVPSFTLLDKKIYVYIAPAVIIDGGRRTFNQNVLRHSFEKLDDSEIDAYKLQLIGVVYIRPNSSYYSLQIEDSRSRGGGVIEELDDVLRRTLEPESDYYWDIGFWDGEAFSDTGSIIIKLDKRILKKYCGKLSEEEVEQAVHKHVAYGTFVIIEYVTVEKDNLAINNLEANDYTV